MKQPIPSWDRLESREAYGELEELNQELRPPRKTVASTDQYLEYGTPMLSNQMNRVQIAGIRDEREAEILLAAGADDLAFPLGPGVVEQDLEEAAAARIIRSLAPPRYGVLITYLDEAASVKNACERIGAMKVQLHGEVPTPEMARLKALRPDLLYHQESRR